MNVEQPITVATNLVIAVQALAYAIHLYKGSAGVSKKMGWAFFAVALGAYLGGVTHAYESQLTSSLKSGIWMGTLISVGLVSVFILSALIELHGDPKRRTYWNLLIIFKFIVFVGGVVYKPVFLLAILDYLPTLLIMLFLEGRKYVQSKIKGSLWIASSVIVFLLGAGVQQSGWVLGALNYNDFYHFVQMAGLWMLYKGTVLRIQDL